MRRPAAFWFRTCSSAESTVRWRTAYDCALGQLQFGFTSASGCAVFQKQSAAVRLGNLPAQNKPDSTAIGFGRKKWNKKIRAIGDARSLIPNKNGSKSLPHLPGDLYSAVRLQRSIHGIAHQIDQSLFNLIGIGVHA